MPMNASFGRHTTFERALRASGTYDRIYQRGSRLEGAENSKRAHRTGESRNSQLLRVENFAGRLTATASSVVSIMAIEARNDL